ncbi:MAG TPA: DinB family protein [Pseudoneobacillus sp.]|nr:DinB family protein [Pseudoneobacillus sp.]
MAYLYSDNLTQTRTNLLNEISKLSSDELNKLTDGSSWSIAQVCHHLYLSEKVFTDAIVYGLNKQNGHHTEPKKIQFALDRTKKLQAPDMVIPEKEHLEVEQINTLLTQSRKRLIDVLNTIEDTSLLEDRSAKHPFFGDLPLFQWIELIYLHEQRHIEQIKEIKLKNNL